MAVQRVEELLRKVTQALNAAGVAYAIIGGNAVAAWVATVDDGAVRATKDVDILLRRMDLPVVATTLHAVGLVLDHAGDVPVFVDAERPSVRTGVHVILAGEMVTWQDRYPAPDPISASQAAAGFRILCLPELVAMKLQAFRPVDRTHLEDLLELGLIDEAVRRTLPVDLGSRLTELENEWRQRPRPGGSGTAAADA